METPVIPPKITIEYDVRDFEYVVQAVQEKQARLVQGMVDQANAALAAAQAAAATVAPTPAPTEAPATVAPTPAPTHATAPLPPESTSAATPATPAPFVARVAPSPPAETVPSALGRVMGGLFGKH